MGYHPTVGRFAQRDPVLYADGMNPYEYVKSNPANLIDPLGLMTLYDTPEKIRKQLNVEIRDPDDSRDAGSITTSRVGNSYTTRVGSGVRPGTAKDVQIDYHETVGIIGTVFNGVGEGDPSGTVGEKGYFPPPWDEAEAEQNNAPYNKTKVGYQEKDTTRTGWHNLALMAELAAYAQKAKPAEQSPAGYAKNRWSSIPLQPFEGADVSPPGKPPVQWQEDLREMTRWICECENKGAAKPYRFTHDTGEKAVGWLGFDKARFRLEIVLECVNKKVQTKTLKMEYYD
jgi:hypothetical protein